MKFVTVVTHSDGYFDFLIQSCQRHNVDLQVLGWGEKFGGWVWRLNMIRDYYKSLDPNEIVCFIDAYDVIILQDSEEIERRFLATKSRFVVAEDFNTDPYEESVARKILFGTCKQVRINAGTYMGYVKELLWMIDAMCEQNDCVNDDKLDDQKMMTQLCNSYPEKFKIDTARNIFLTLCYRNGMELADIRIDDETEQLVYRDSAYPCILHGAGKANLDDIIKSLGYNITIKQTPTSVVQHIYFRQVIISGVYVAGFMIFFVIAWLLFRSFGSGRKPSR